MPRPPFLPSLPLSLSTCCPLESVRRRFSHAYHSPLCPSLPTSLPSSLSLSSLSLLQEGANPTLVNHEGHTALEISLAKNVPASVRVLKVGGGRDRGREGRTKSRGGKGNTCRAVVTNQALTSFFPPSSFLPFLSPPSFIVEVPAREGNTARTALVQGPRPVRRRPHPPPHPPHGKNPRREGLLL